MGRSWRHHCPISKPTAIVQYDNLECDIDRARYFLDFVYNSEVSLDVLCLRSIPLLLLARGFGRVFRTVIQVVPLRQTTWDYDFFVPRSFRRRNTAEYGCTCHPHFCVPKGTS